MCRAVALFEQNEIDDDERWDRVGALLDQSHESLRDRYAVSTPKVEQLRDFIRDTPGVYGARLMGGGFGGNVLALVAPGAVMDVVEHLKRDYYIRQGRDPDSEGSIMVSSPGSGLMLQ